MKALLLAAGLAVAVPATALAGMGLNLGWGLACPTSASAMPDVTDACDANNRTYTLIGSVVAPDGLSKVTAEEIVVDVEVAGGVLPPWWHLEDETATLPAGCRGVGSANPNGSLSVTDNFLSAPTTTCKNYWGTSLNGAFNYTPNFAGMDCGRIQAVFARTVETAGPMTPGVQYYAFNLTLDTQHTVADPTDPALAVCSGCQVGACIDFVYCKLDQPPGTPNGDVLVNQASTRGFVTWQGAQGVQCIFVSPVRRATWGQIKSLYR